MTSNASYLSYRETGYFSRLVSDYIDGAEALQPFLEFPPDLTGIKKAISGRKDADPANRGVLVAQLNKQYDGVDTSDSVRANINALSNCNAYTICTAHQPNLFTGHLYFVYKILHAVRLADHLNMEMPDLHFVPVFYMGSEDADLEELGQVNIHNKNLVWATAQNGAVGRMKTDDKLLALIDEIEGQLSVEKFGKEMVSLLRTSYIKGETIEQATFLLVNELFKEFGLVILLPDNAELKTLFIPTVRGELLEQSSSKAVSKTLAEFPAVYKVQAVGRDINLFYLKDDVRERIEKSGDKFSIANTDIIFTTDEILAELETYPERFSPNVITRPLYQETILPNIAFIGGGAELAYWLELKAVFRQANIHFPVLVLRNSFLIIDQKNTDKITALHLTPADFFENETKLVARLVALKSDAILTFDKEKDQLAGVYKNITNCSTAVDPTLEKHVQALCVQALHRVTLLEKKLLRAEKRKFMAEQRQIAKIRSALFPGGSLQERVDNLLPYYSTYGKSFLHKVYESSQGIEMQFCILTMS